MNGGLISWCVTLGTDVDGGDEGNFGDAVFDGVFDGVDDGETGGAEDVEYDVVVAEDGGDVISDDEEEGAEETVVAVDLLVW